MKGRGSSKFDGWGGGGGLKKLSKNTCEGVKLLDSKVNNYKPASLQMEQWPSGAMA